MHRIEVTWSLSLLPRGARRDASLAPRRSHSVRVRRSLRESPLLVVLPTAGVEVELRAAGGLGLENVEALAARRHLDLLRRSVREHLLLLARSARLKRREAVARLSDTEAARLQGKGTAANVRLGESLEGGHVALLHHGHGALDGGGLAVRNGTREVGVVGGRNRELRGRLLKLKDNDLVVALLHLHRGQEQRVLRPLHLPVASQVEAVHPHHALAPAQRADVRVLRRTLHVHHTLEEVRAGRRHLRDRLRLHRSHVRGRQVDAAELPGARKRGAVERHVRRKSLRVKHAAAVVQPAHDLHQNVDPRSLLRLEALQRRHVRTPDGARHAHSVDEDLRAVANVARDREHVARLRRNRAVQAVSERLSKLLHVGGRGQLERGLAVRQRVERHRRHERREARHLHVAERHPHAVGDEVRERRGVVRLDHLTHRQELVLRVAAEAVVAVLRDRRVVVVRRDVGREAGSAAVRSGEETEVGASEAHVQVERVTVLQAVGQRVRQTLRRGVGHGLAPVRQPAGVQLRGHARVHPGRVELLHRIARSADAAVAKGDHGRSLERTARHVANRPAVRGVHVRRVLAERLLRQRGEVLHVLLVRRLRRHVAVRAVLVLHLRHDDGPAVRVQVRLQDGLQLVEPLRHVVDVVRLVRADGDVLVDQPCGESTELPLAADVRSLTHHQQHAGGLHITDERLQVVVALEVELTLRLLVPVPGHVRLHRVHAQSLHALKDVRPVATRGAGVVERSGQQLDLLPVKPEGVIVNCELGRPDARAREEGRRRAQQVRRHFGTFNEVQIL
eukprot:Rhum_TRINITY_DN18633_c0_g1::Rhum_TRINITY_DN18633_c0_g1_i1::g.167788::m.167788